MNRCEYFSAAQPALRSSYPFQVQILSAHIFLKASFISSDVTVVRILNKHSVLECVVQRKEVHKVGLEKENQAWL